MRENVLRNECENNFCPSGGIIQLLGNVLQEVLRVSCNEICECNAGVREVALSLPCDRMCITCRAFSRRPKRSTHDSREYSCSLAKISV